MLLIQQNSCGIFMTNPIKLKKEDIENLFWHLTETEKKSCRDAIDSLDEDSYRHMGLGYMLAIERCRQTLKTILKDIE
jgi:hypothetical protein